MEFSRSVKEFAAKEKLEIVKVQDFGSEFLARPSPPQAAKCVRTILRIDHCVFQLILQGDKPMCDKPIEKPEGEEEKGQVELPNEIHANCGKCPLCGAELVQLDGGDGVFCPKGCLI